MSITPLSAARIVGEVGLAGGTITGGSCAAHYSKQLGKKIEEVIGEEAKSLAKCLDEIHGVDNSKPQEIKSKVSTCRWTFSNGISKKAPGIYSTAYNQ